MSVSRFLRRLHLYLGVALVPWFFIYALGAAVLNHPKLCNELFKGDEPAWTVRSQKEYHRDVPDDGDLHASGEAILKDFGLDGWSFWTNRTRGGRRLVVHAYKFLATTEVLYDIDKGQATVRDQRFRWDRFFVGMHERGGFEHSTGLRMAWAVIVDLVGAAVVAWVLTGIYMWWTSRQRRLAGGIVLAAGVATFVVLVNVL